LSISISQRNFELITDVPTDGGWLFLVVVLGLCARKLIAGQMRDHMRAELSIAALTMAIQKQKPHNGLIHHSDPRQPRHRGKVPQAH
jgi:transposase InsO family protein